jgi:flagellar biosynthesis protein FlhG
VAENDAVPEIIAVGSGKGGVGKARLAITLGQALSRLCRRVLVFDGDLGLANVDIQLNFAPVTDLGSVLAGRATLASVITRCPGTGFDLICGRSGSGRLAQLPRERIDCLLSDLMAVARDHDVLLLDLPAGIDRMVRGSLERATLRLVVATDEPTALTDAYALIKVSEQDVASGRLALVINMARDPEGGRQTFDGLSRVCDRFLQLRPSLAGIVRRDPRVPDTIRHQIPLLTRHPLSDAARDIEALTCALVGRP